MREAGAMLTEAQRRRALDYPYPIPDRSFAFDAATGMTTPWPDVVVRTHRLVDEQDGAPFYDLDLEVAGTVQTLQRVCPVVAAGSNASPQQLVRKFHGRTGDTVVALRVPFRDVVPVYSAHITAYGAVAACLGEHPGAGADLFITLLPPQALALMHATESLGVEYDFAPLPEGTCLAPALSGMRLTYYASRHGPVRQRDGTPIALASFTVRDCGLRQASEPEVLAAALAALLPEHGFEAALAAMLGSAELRAEAVARLKDLPLDLDCPA